MADVHGFDQAGVKRIVRTVRAVERDPRTVGAGAVPNVAPTPTFWIELTAEPTTGRYSWKKVYPSPTAAGGWVEASPAVTGTGTASEVNLTPGIPAGVRVRAEFIGYNGSNPVFMFPIAIVDQRWNSTTKKIEVDYGGGHWVEKVTFGPCP